MSDTAEPVAEPPAIVEPESELETETAGGPPAPPPCTPMQEEPPQIVFPEETMFVTTEEDRGIEAVIGEPTENGVAVVKAILEPEPEVIPGPPEPEPKPIVVEESKFTLKPEREPSPLKKEPELVMVQRIAKPNPGTGLIVELSTNPQPEFGSEPVIAIVERVATEHQPEPENVRTPAQEVQEPEPEPLSAKKEPAPVIAVVERVATDPGGILVVKRVKTELGLVTEPAEEVKAKLVPEEKAPSVPELEKLAEKLKVKKRDRIRRVTPVSPLTKILLGREIAEIASILQKKKANGEPLPSIR